MKNKERSLINRLIISLIQAAIVIGIISLIPFFTIMRGWGSKNVNSVTANELLKEIKKLKFVQNARLYNRGSLTYSINIQTLNVYENGLKIYGIAKEYLTTEIMNEIMKELEYEYPPNIVIDIWHKHGRIFSFEGSRYKPGTIKEQIQKLSKKLLKAKQNPQPTNLCVKSTFNTHILLNMSFRSAILA